MLLNLSEDTEQNQNLNPRFLTSCLLFCLVYQVAGTQEFGEKLKPIPKVSMVFVIAKHPKKDGPDQSSAMHFGL